MDIIGTVSRLAEQRDLDDAELAFLIESEEAGEPLARAADTVRRRIYGDRVFIRGLIEFTSYCKNDCYYCGIRCSNRQAERFRLTPEQIYSCCEEGYRLGFRTFVMQGGEDPYFTDDRICEIVSSISHHYPDCAVTLSIGEKSFESYKAFREAGAKRFLLRHETADHDHYRKLHPDTLSSENRQRCLFDLKKLGYQVGSGFMVGSPFQTTENLIHDLRFLQKLDPDMIGIGPFITHKQTPFAEYENGSVELTLRLLSILRLMFPHALIPATTALGTLAEDGRERGLRSGANVVMPNLSPADVRQKYNLYDNKIYSGAESAQSLDLLKQTVERAGYRIVTDVGNVDRSNT
jgi:biotin synthase